MKPVQPLGVGLVQKGSAAPPSAPEQVVAPAVVEPPAALDPPIRQAVPDNTVRLQVGPRLPIDMIQELRLMCFETGRKQTDIIEDFCRAGLKRWREQRRRAAQPQQGD
jgi:hypothetical protein